MNKHSHSGFTIVELLITVVVMAILASAIALSYKGVHERARDTKRTNDIVAIREALGTYRASKGMYPSSYTGPYNGWDASTGNGATPFIEDLELSGYMDHVPIDPLNTAPIGSDWTTGYRYQYKKFSDMSYLSSIGCATTRGSMVVLMAVTMESVGNPAPDSPGFSCAGRNFTAEGSWVWGDYEKPE